MSIYRKPSARQRRINDAVEAELGSAVICARCGCTLATFADKCSADLDEACPGFQRIDKAKMRAEAVNR